MGPAQFLPSTWNLFADRLKNLLGQTADPWAIKDSFTASALYLSDLGASAQTTTAESQTQLTIIMARETSREFIPAVLCRAICIQTLLTMLQCTDF